MENKTEAEFVDNSYVVVKIPFKNVQGIIKDIENLFKHKDISGKNNIGAYGGTIDLLDQLRLINERGNK